MPLRTVCNGKGDYCQFVSTDNKPTWRRTVEPSIMESAEIVATLRELMGVKPVRTAFLIAALMGMRRGEIFGPKWVDVDVDHAILHIRRSFVNGVVGLPKTDTSRCP
jgi:integrase